MARDRQTLDNSVKAILQNVYIGYVIINLAFYLHI